MNIYEAINNVKLSLGKIHKDGKNPHFKSTHLTLAGISEALEPVLAENKLALLQRVNGLSLITELRLLGSDGDNYLLTDMPLIGNDMQKLGSAITYARRYSIVALFGILDTDDDAETTMGRLTTEEKIQLIHDLWISKDIDKDAFFKHFDISELAELKESQLDLAIDGLTSKKNKECSYEPGFNKESIGDRA